jgi:hypothetical protein
VCPDPKIGLRMETKFLESHGMNQRVCPEVWKGLIALNVTTIWGFGYNVTRSGGTSDHLIRELFTDPPIPIQPRYSKRCEGFAKVDWYCDSGWRGQRFADYPIPCPKKLRFPFQNVPPRTPCGLSKLQLFLSWPITARKISTITPPPSA